jgi:hypothetical protein
LPHGNMILADGPTVNQDMFTNRRSDAASA